jgi:hypothetical protein
VFERGFWKGADNRRAELEVLDKIEVVEATDGVIEEDCDDILSEKACRWIRIFQSTVGITGVVKGFTMHEDTMKVTEMFRKTLGQASISSDVHVFVLRG